MYKVMIVDDEIIIRNGLSLVVDWSDYGFEIIGEAANGIEGLDMIMDKNPDLILVDIRMPGLDGIEMLSEIRKLGYNGKAIILTGYAEFAYAKTAVALGVSAYMLKPIDEDELVKILESVREELDNEKSHLNIINQYENLSLEKNCKSLMIDGVDMDINHELFDGKSNYNCVIVSMDVYSIEKSMDDKELRLSINEIIKDFVSYQPSCYYFPYGDCGYIIYRNKSFNQLDILLNNLLKQLKRNRKGDYFITIGRKVKGYKNLNRSCMDSNNLLRKRFLFRNEEIVFWDSYVDEKDNNHYDNLDTNYIYGLIEVGNKNALEVYMAKFEDTLAKSELSVEKIRGICINMFIELKEKISYNYQTCSQCFQSRTEIVDKIYSSKNLNEIIKYFFEVFNEVSSMICDGSSKNTTKRLLNYIHTNYYKNLKLEGISRLFGYNSSYLGQLFKENVGKSFNTYLDEIRIEHAKELIKSKDYKIYEIASKVGYSNVDYFYTKFKNAMGESPKSYEKTLHVRSEKL